MKVPQDGEFTGNPSQPFARIRRKFRAQSRAFRKTCVIGRVDFSTAERSGNFPVNLGGTANIPFVLRNKSVFYFFSRAVFLFFRPTEMSKITGEV